MRRSDHPNRPSAITCCFLSSLKTLLTLTQGNSRVRINVLDQTFVGRFSSDNHWPHLSDYRGHWARVATMSDERSRKYYAKLRARGHSHGRALRTLADRWLCALVAMLKTRERFDPAKWNSCLVNPQASTWREIFGSRGRKGRSCA